MRASVHINYNLDEQIGILPKFLLWALVMSSYCTIVLEARGSLITWLVASRQGRFCLVDLRFVYISTVDGMLLVDACLNDWFSSASETLVMNLWKYWSLSRISMVVRLFLAECSLKLGCSMKGEGSRWKLRVRISTDQWVKQNLNYQGCFKTRTSSFHQRLHQVGSRLVT